MNDETKTKEQLLGELVMLRQRVSELELAASERQQVAAALKGQVQERTN